MKILIIGLFFSVGVRAEMFEAVPEEYCDQAYYDCSQVSVDTFKSYLAANAPALNAEESLYVGSCHMVSESYNKDHEHYAYLYFRKQQDKVGFFGMFSFFSEETPYADMTLEQARQLNAENSNYNVRASATEWRVDTNVEPPWQYFMREAGRQLYVVGFWGYDDSITCVLEKK